MEGETSSRGAFQFASFLWFMAAYLSLTQLETLGQPPVNRSMGLLRFLQSTQLKRMQRNLFIPAAAFFDRLKYRLVLSAGIFYSETQ